MKAPRAVLATAFFAMACAPGEREFGDSLSADGGGSSPPTVSPHADAGETPSASGDASVTESDNATTGAEDASVDSIESSVETTAVETATGAQTASGVITDRDGTGSESGRSPGSIGTTAEGSSAVDSDGSNDVTSETTLTGETYSDVSSVEPSSAASSTAVTSSEPWGTENTTSEPITAETSGGTGTELECQTATDCPPAPNYCHGVECTYGKCDYPHAREGEACGASGECSEDRCTDGECKPVSINEGSHCGESNAFCLSQGSCQRGGCELSSACTYTVSGSYVEDNSYGYTSGSTAYFLGTNYEEMYVTGTLVQAATLTFQIHLPAYNPAATCGGQPNTTSAVIWIFVNGTRVSSPSNWQLAEAGWTASGPWSIPAGAFEIKVYAGEGDGCGWPVDTPPIYVSDFEFGPAAP